MEINKEMVVYTGYREYKNALDSELARTAEGFVRIGYLLRLAADTDILSDSGYKNVLEFAKAEYGLDKTEVSRFMAINKRFSVNGYSDKLELHYQGFGYAKLSIMLQLPESVNEVLTPTFSKAEIQVIKNEVDEEKKVSDLELLTEDVVIDLENMDTLQKVLYQMGRENPELFLKLYEAKEADAKEYQEILAPSGEGLISVRIQGVGRLMFSVKDVDRDLSLVNVRSNEKELYTWERLTEELEFITGRDMTGRPEDGRTWWQMIYKTEWPLENKEKVAPVQQTQPEPQKPRKESKVTVAKPEPPKAEKKMGSEAQIKSEEAKKEDVKLEEIKEAEPEAVIPKPEMEEDVPEMPESVIKAPESVLEKSKVVPVQQETHGETGVEGQMSVTDFPEYLPEDYVVAADGTEVLPAKTEKIQYPKYEIKKGEFGYELYDDNMLLVVCRSANNAMLIKVIMEKDTYTGNETDCNFTKEDCEKFFEESEE